MTGRLDPAEVLAAIKAVIAREVERVDDPLAGTSGGDPSDAGGWHSHGTTDGPGVPYYNPETWRWFRLVDLTYLDPLVLVEFRWIDPTMPQQLLYLLFCNLGGVDSIGLATSVVRSELRAQIAPGWRERLHHHWIDRSHVLLWRKNDVTQENRDAYGWSAQL